MAGQPITKSILVKTEVPTAFRIWSNFENFPLFMEDVESVKNVTDTLTHWKMKGPMGTTVEWYAEITRDEENKRIAWNTKDRGDDDVTTSGQVTFNSLPDNMTEVTMMTRYEPKKGMGGNLSKLFDNPEKRVEKDLRNFKRYVEGMADKTSVSR